MFWTLRLACDLCSFFFFKQKTAYEMRISDWSSDVCSSDLLAHEQCRGGKIGSHKEGLADQRQRQIAYAAQQGKEHQRAQPVKPSRRNEIGRASCRERVCQYV